MGFSRQEYWSGLPFPSPGDLPDSGIEPGSSALQVGSLTAELAEKLAINCCNIGHILNLLRLWNIALCSSGDSNSLSFFLLK